ncbi:hypothetical protein LOTGIDRAFT_159473 [Lottia gigantea]|uniref:CBF1-interacting co-repressor CIR N-terminal domain-containing protein n=1 Tax=Lottia gigantea TaxID=225164 RepID=V4AUJ6_LOTGI|nr:hypothetical protein LOTGIDRAFT_159473 [Lottia gigantea]ESO97441.1 hypothetical protein LOTGIDRAFT_159473 [Lottia gigantea]
MSWSVSKSQRKRNWHVRTKKNIERVRRDEEKAAEEEKEKQRRIALAEQEARTDLLRSRSKNKLKTCDRNEIEQGSSTDIVPSSTVTQHGNINFFKEIEDGLRKQGINEEHAKEKKVEKEKWERSVGLLTYLGKSNIEEQNETPWYLSGRKRKRDETEEEEKRDLKHLKEEKKKTNLDPLLEMREFVDKKKKKKKHKDKKDKKHKHKERERERIKSLPKPSTGKTIDQLRAERLKREKAEKNRTAELFSKLKGDDSENSSESEEEDRSRKYNSQYNPELSRKYKKHKPNDYS